MAWSDPRDWTTGEVVTAAIMNAHVRDNFDQTAPAKLTTAGDMLYATGANAPARLAKGTNGNILHQASCAPAWTASPSITGITLSGTLDANGSIDFDGTTLAACASGAITLTSTSTSANGVYLRANGGTSETVKIHSDQGTSVTEGAASVSLLSDAGGVELRSTANLANAVNITNDGGTTGTITIFNDQGSSVTEGAASIELLSDAGGVELRSTANLANAINLTNDAVTTGTITIFQDQGTSVTEGAASIELLSDAGGVELRSTANLANAIALTSDGGTTGSILIFNDQGTTATEGSSSIQLLSDVGAVGIKSGLNAAGAIRLTADAGTSETIILHADQGSGVGSICLTSDAGGITLNPATFVTVGGNATNAGEIRILEDTDHGSNYVAIKSGNVTTSYTLTLPTAVAGGNCYVLQSTNAGVLSWAASSGGTTINNATNNELVTVGSCTSELCAEADLTFDGTTLSILSDTGTGNTAGLNIYNDGAASTCRKSFIRFAQNRTTGGETSAAWLYSSLTNIACSGYTGKLNINVASNGAPAAVMEITRAAVAHYGGCENTPGITFLCDLDTGLYRPGANVLGIVNGGGCDEGARFDRGAGNSGGRLLQGESDNSNQAAGITTNVLSHNDQIWATKSSDIAHGMTATGETDTFGAIFKINDGWGGIRMHGWTENVDAFIINGYQSSGNTTKSTSASAALKLNAAMKGTTNVGGLCTNANILNVTEDGVVRFIFDKEGSGHSDVEWTTYDDYQDIELLRGVHGALKPDFKKDFGSDLLYNLCTYTKLGLVGECSLHWEQNKEGKWQHRAMVNWQGMSMLHHSAIIQLADRMDARLTALENQVALQGGK